MAPGRTRNRYSALPHRTMTLFALLHGGLHYGSCWDAVTTELARRGHRVIAPDLPVDDDSAGALEWAQVAIAAIEREADGASDDVVVVAHSISGLCAPVIATLYPVRRMVFVGGLLPVPGHSFVEHLAANPDAITFPEPQEQGTGPFGLTWESVREGFYHDCPESMARHAFSELRHQAFTVFTGVARSAAGPIRRRPTCSCGTTAPWGSRGLGATRSAGSGHGSSGGRRPLAVLCPSGRAECGAAKPGRPRHAEIAAAVTNFDSSDASHATAFATSAGIVTA